MKDVFVITVSDVVGLVTPRSLITSDAGFES